MTEDSFPIIRKLGIPLCETFLCSYSEYKKEFTDLLNERRGDTEVISVHTLTQQFEPDLFNYTERARKDCEYVFDKVAHAAFELGAPYYTFHGPAKLRHVPYRLHYESLGRRVEELCGFLREHSLGTTSLCYENVHWCYFSEPSYFTEIKKYSPSVKACLDVKQALQSGFSPEEYIQTMDERLTNVHLCDYNGETTALPGKGVFDFVKLFDTLLTSGYEGDAVMEVYSNDYTDYDELAEAYEYLLNCLYTVQR